MKTPLLDESQKSVEEVFMSPLQALNRFADLPHITTASEPQFDNTTGRMSYGFRLANLGFVISAETNSEVMEPLPIFPLPNTPSWFLGLSNLRGNIVPVYNLEKAFDIHADEEGKRYLMVLGKNDQAVGVMISGLPQPLILDEAHVMTDQPPLPKSLREFATKTYMIDQQPWIEFDHRDFFQALVIEHSAQL